MKYKVLMNCGYFVDTNNLDLGIYHVSEPTLLPNTTTIEGIIAMFEEKVKKEPLDTNNKLSVKHIMTNLSVCELVEVTLTF